MRGVAAMKTDGTPFQVRTDKPVKKDAIPRMPHERDESQDSQASGQRDVIRQGYLDVTNGQVNTDLREQRGVEETVEPQTIKKASPKQPAVTSKTKAGRT
jgi:hypothetical protein